MIRNLLPQKVQRVLWGNRVEYGLVPDERDPDWLVWQEKAYTDFYQNTQQKGIGNEISQMAYPILSHIDFSEKKVLEVGPGIIRHLDYISTDIRTYILCDIDKEFVKHAERQLRDSNINCQIILKQRNDCYLPLKDNSIDILITFNSLEHLYPLEDYLQEFERALRAGGLIVGGIPCEGSFAWGLGRYLTTRRYVHKNYGINYDKIICWEHPNFADFIIAKLDKKFSRRFLKLHPFSGLPMDLNFVANFIYEKK